MKTVAFLLPSAFAALVACSRPSEKNELSSSETDPIRTEIQKLENDYARSVNENNLHGIMSYYAEDAISYNAYGPPLRGEEAIRSDIRRRSSAFPASARIYFSVQEVLPSSDKLQVVEIGRYDIKDEANITFGSGNYISVFEKRGGRYVCIRDMQTPDSPTK